MSIFNVLSNAGQGIAGIIKKKRKKRRKRRKAKQRKQQERDAMRNKLNAGFNTTPQSSADALNEDTSGSGEPPSGDAYGTGRSDNQATMSNPVMLAIVGLLAYKFLLKK